MEDIKKIIPDHHIEFRNLYHEFLMGKLGVRTPLPLRRLITLALVRSILVSKGFVTQSQIQEIEISHHPSGQPYITIKSTPPQESAKFPCISLSHSGTWVGCALSNDGRPVGIDLEDYSHSIPRPYMDLATHSFSLIEIEFVKQYGEEGFYRLWTAKEAIAKCQGQGLDRALSLNLGEQFLSIFRSLKNVNNEISFILNIPPINTTCSKSESYIIQQTIPEKNIMATIAKKK